jgi:hypothetical protein
MCVLAWYLLHGYAQKWAGCKVQCANSQRTRKVICLNPARRGFANGLHGLQGIPNYFGN